MNKLIQQGKKIFFAQQTTVLAAAWVIMLLTFGSQVLGFIRARVVLHFFTTSDSALFFAALRLPELVFEILMYGMFSSAFIPVFSRAIKKGQERDAWDIAGRVVNLGLVIFGVFAIIMGIWADRIYAAVAPGYSSEQIATIANLARVLFIAQGIFIVSYVLTGVLESLKRFLIPALAPIFYNLGLILGTVLLSNRFGLAAPAIGVVAGAFVHLLIQVPLAFKLGFRFTYKFKPNEGVKSIIHLAAPRLVDLSFQQVVSMIELYFASIISTASYTYLTVANSLQLAPVRLFGTSLAKAALPTLTHQEDSPEEFRTTLLSTLYQIFFLVMPVVTFFIIMRIPTTRLFFGTVNFDWNATVQTGMVLSAYAIGIAFQATVAVLARAFYAFHDTKTPVTVSVIGDSIVIVGDFVLIKAFGLPLWALALSFSLGAFVETVILLHLIGRRIHNMEIYKIAQPIVKSVFAAFVSGASMYFFLKFLDKSVWEKRGINPSLLIPFDKLILDTRYTVNLIILTAVVGLVGLASYVITSYLLKSSELSAFIAVAKRNRMLLRITGRLEPVTETPSDISS